MASAQEEISLALLHLLESNQAKKLFSPVEATALSLLFEPLMRVFSPSSRNPMRNFDTRKFYEAGTKPTEKLS